MGIEANLLESEAAKNRAIAVDSLEKAGASYLVDIHVKGDEVQLLSTMTLIYQIIPVPEGSVGRFCDECIDVARRAIQKHLECMEHVRQDVFAKTIYVHWYFLSSWLLKPSDCRFC